MSASTEPTLDFKEQLVRIDRAIAETRKLQNESDKFAAETRKMTRDYHLSLFLAAAALLGGVLGAASFVLRLMGKG